MRLRLAWVLFVLGVVAAGCGGGGKSGIVPNLAPNNGPGNTVPTAAKSTRASISLYVPPANKQASRKPLYISPNTQAFGVLVLPYVTPLPSPVPTSGLQIFPVTTPSPCAAASGGGETCTFTVTAPVGTDVFIVAAFASVSPPPNAGPLSAFVSGPVTVSLSPSPGASPLGFTLNGVVNSVAVAVNSPDPGNTPNTQVFTIGVPTSAPIAITAYDSSGNAILSDPTTPYFNPIVVQASPAAAGLTLSLIGSSVCGSSASGAVATIDCGSDLSDVQVSYDGTPRPDASDHLIDAFSVYSTTAPNPTPSPANFVLQSNMLTTQLATGSFINGAFLRRTAGGQLAYLAYVNSAEAWELGTFDPTTGIVGAPTMLSDTNTFGSVAFMPDGSYWVMQNSSQPYTLECYASLTATTPTLTGISPTENYDGGTVYLDSIAADGSGNLWYSGWDWDYQGGGPPAPPQFAGHFASTGCATPSTTVAQFTLTNAYGDSSPNSLIAVNAAGTAAVATQSIYLQSNPYNAVWMMNSGSSSTVSGTQTLNAASYGHAIAIDGAGNSYTAFVNGQSPADIEKLSAGSMSSLLALPPNGSGAYPSPQPTALYVFSPNGTAADRGMYVDTGYSALTLIEALSGTPLPIIVSLPDASSVYDAAYSSKGGEYVLDVDTSNNFNLVRMLPTTTWSVPNVTLVTQGCTNGALLAILERGDSGPFTVTATGGVTVTPVPGADHDFWLTGFAGSENFQVSVTDAHGRTATSLGVSEANGCTAAHRPFVHHRR